MLDIKKTEEFKKVVYTFFREHDDIDARDMAALLKAMFEYYATDHTKSMRTMGETRGRLDEQTVKDFREMWEGFVQQSIDFVRNHEDVQKAIEDDRQEIIDEWNPKKDEKGVVVTPDLRLSFGVDGLESSVEHGEWVAATDSGISLRIGPRSIIEMM